MSWKSKTSWYFVWDSLENEDALIRGISIMKGEWTSCGQTAVAVDPRYGKAFTCPIYRAESADGKVVEMAMTEISNNVYLAFVNCEHVAMSVTPKSKRKIAHGPKLKHS